MTIKTPLFDAYSLRARLYPAFLALLPLALAALAWAQPGTKWITATWSLLAAAGVTFFLANFARNKGKSIEPELWKAWGGSPTIQLLRHSGIGNCELRQRWHKQLSKLLSKPMPSPMEEKDDPAGADEIYEAAIRLLIGKTRDTKKFPFVYRDNVNYGFCRNLFALRFLGITTTLVGAILSVVAGVSFWMGGRKDVLPWVCAIVCVLMLLWWFFSVTSDWVKVPAINYAQHLLEASEKISRS